MWLIWQCLDESVQWRKNFKPRSMCLFSPFFGSKCHKKGMLGHVHVHYLLTNCSFLQLKGAMKPGQNTVTSMPGLGVSHRACSALCMSAAVRMTVVGVGVFKSASAAITNICPAKMVLFSLTLCPIFKLQTSVTSLWTLVATVFAEVEKRYGFCTRPIQTAHLQNSPLNARPQPNLLASLPIFFPAFLLKCAQIACKRTNIFLILHSIKLYLIPT